MHYKKKKEKQFDVMSSTSLKKQKQTRLNSNECKGSLANPPPPPPPRHHHHRHHHHRTGSAHWNLQS
jgi:hypothetical protein